MATACKKTIATACKKKKATACKKINFPTTTVEFPNWIADFSKSGVVTKTFAPKLCAEWSDREVHSSHGDYFVTISAPKLIPIPKNLVITKTFAPKFCA